MARKLASWVFYNCVYEENRVFYNWVYMHMESLTSYGVSLNFCFIIGYPPYFVINMNVKLTLSTTVLILICHMRSFNVIHSLIASCVWNSFLWLEFRLLYFLVDYLFQLDTLRRHCLNNWFQYHLVPFHPNMCSKHSEKVINNPCRQMTVHWWPVICQWPSVI